MSAADRGGRVAPPPTDPSEATGRVKRRDNQLHRARVLEEDAMGRAARMAISSLTSIDGVPRCPGRTI